VFNFLGPVANPARPGAQAVGVSDPRMGEVIAGVLAGRGSSALVFHGDDGLDELTTTDTSTVWLVHGGAVTATTVDPVALGLDRAKPGDLRGGDPAHNAAVVRAVLDGEPGAVRDTVVLNAAAALAAAAGVPSVAELDQALADGCVRAAAAVDSGAAGDLLRRWAAASQRLAPSPAGPGDHPRNPRA
jgi:anthranilate phosphoribosyltransferase